MSDPFDYTTPLDLFSDEIESGVDESLIELLLVILSDDLIQSKNAHRYYKVGEDPKRYLYEMETILKSKPRTSVTEVFLSRIEEIWQMVDRGVK